MVPPRAYDHDVKAFLVLSHAALEQGFEEISLASCIDAVDAWNNGAITRAAFCLVLCLEGKLTLESNDRTLDVRSGNMIRDSLDRAKVTYSKVIHDNHGVSAKYLNDILTPVAIDLTLDASEEASLLALRNARGEHAHKLRATVIQSPEDAVASVKDVLEVFRRATLRAAGNAGAPTHGLKAIRTTKSSF